MRSLLTAAAISLAFTLFLTPVFLRLFRKWGWGQVIRTPDDVHNPSHGEKRGTPTMGGTIFIVGTIVGYLVGAFTGNNPPTISGWLVMWMMVGFGAVGFIDDYMKVQAPAQPRSERLAQDRRSDPRRGAVRDRGAELSERLESDARLGVRLGLPRRADAVVHGARAHHRLAAVPRVDLVHRGRVLQQRQRHRRPRRARRRRGHLRRRRLQPRSRSGSSTRSCSGGATLSDGVASACYATRDPFDLAIVSAAFIGALVGFLWWNAPKANVFMGDVGSMAIGGVHRRDGDPHPHRAAVDPHRRRLRASAPARSSCSGSTSSSPAANDCS